MLHSIGIKGGIKVLDGIKLDNELTLKCKDFPGLSGWAQYVYMCQVAESCPALRAPMNCSQPGSSVHGILQARILEWVAMPSSRESSQPRGQTCISALAGRFFTTEPLGKPLLKEKESSRGGQRDAVWGVLRPSLWALKVEEWAARQGKQVAFELERAWPWIVA